jgi:hypothetical protein
VPDLVPREGVLEAVATTATYNSSAQHGDRQLAEVDVRRADRDGSRHEREGLVAGRCDEPRTVRCTRTVGD